MTNIVIVSATRTAVTAFGGGFAKRKAADLGADVIKEALLRAKVDPNDVTEVIMGQVLSGGLGMGPARQAAMAAGVPAEKTAYAVNQICGSGLRTVANGAMAIQSGDADIIVAGGMENMSQSQHASFMRDGFRMGNGKLVDTMVYDGLTDVFNQYHMGVTAENIAEKYGITREMQDIFATESQVKAEAAMAADKFKEEIVPVVVPNRKGDITIDKDEHPKAGVTVEGLAKMRPAFKKDGTVTAANASGINDGAAAVVLMSEEEAKKRGLTPLATIKSWATAGCAPEVMGLGPVPSSKKALEKAGWTVDDLDLIEANEAFAVQAIAVNKDMGWDVSKVNVNGGAIALGHPIGASGARVLVTLLFEMQKRDSKKGLVTLCIGGGMGITMCLER